VFKHKPKRDSLPALYEIVFEYIRREAESDYSTGLVIAGYGRDELFPSIYHYIVDGRFGDVTRCWRAGKVINLNTRDLGGGAIIPFAQSDMAHLFMEGIYWPYLDFVRKTVQAVLDGKSEGLLKDYGEDDKKRSTEETQQKKDNEIIVGELLKEFFGKYRAKRFVQPVMRTVSALPKEEMALMAKAIVELTALRRKIASNLESVGGEIDVAIISKGDGFVWINRKHYFDIPLNSDFSYRRTLLRENDDEAAQAGGRKRRKSRSRLAT
jgi:hypothetical protein